MTWLRLHWSALLDALKHIRSAAGSFGLNSVVVAIALALPTAGLTVLENVRPLSEQLAVEPELSIFLGMEVPREQASALAPELRTMVRETRHQGRLEFVPRERALSILKEKTGLAEAVTALGENPLPDAYILKLAGIQNADDAVRVEELAVKLKSLPGVEYVQIDSAWVKRLAALLHVLRVALVFLAVSLSVAVVAVVFNTIRLQVMTQREEIEVCRMFGATDSFIYRPFYYTGTLLGLFAGAIALGVVALSLHPLNAAIAQFARLYASEFRLSPLAFWPAVYVMGAGGGLGLLGAVFCVRRTLMRTA